MNEGTRTDPPSRTAGIEYHIRVNPRPPFRAGATLRGCIGLVVRRGSGAHGALAAATRTTLKARISSGGSGQAFAALCTERNFERGFQADYSSREVFNVQLLLGDCGVELLHPIGQFNGPGECIPDPLGEAHR